MSKRFIFSSVILLALFICALFAPYLSSFDPQQVEISNKLMAPDAVHLLGTDVLGVLPVDRIRWERGRRRLNAHSPDHIRRWCPASARDRCHLVAHGYHLAVRGFRPRGLGLRSWLHDADSCSCGPGWVHEGRPVPVPCVAS